MPYSPGRRRFVQLMGWAGVATIAQGGPSLAQAAARSRTSAKHEPAHPVTLPAKVDTTSAAAKGPSEEAKALAEAFRRRYPDRVTPEELKSITNDLDGDLQGIATLRKSRLANSDEPDVTFHA
jgi:hypothetical protein